MAVSVRIEDEAFSDERFDDLATMAGLVDGDHARGKMARLWRQCTLETRYVLPRATVLRVLGDRGVEALVSARLGEEVGDGIRIRGTRGRVEWLKKLRSNGKFGRLGGRPRTNPDGSRSGNPDGFSTKPSRVRKSAENETPPTSVPTSVTATAKTPDPDKLSGASGRASRLDPTWVPSRSSPNESAEAKAKARGVDLRGEMAKLRDWAAGTGAKRVDWDAVWRNWTRNAKASQRGAAPTVLQTLLADIDVMQRDEDRKKTEEDS